MRNPSDLPPDVIFFDAVGTLIHLPDSVGKHYAEVVSRFGVAADPEELDAAFIRIWKGMPLRAPLGKARPDDDRGWWRELVMRVLEGVGVQPVATDECFEALYDRFVESGVWALYPDTIPTLERLSGAHRLAVISNFDGRLHEILRQLGISDFFEQVIVSSEIGADKPHPEIFDAALAGLNVPAARALHVGDQPKLDWEAAESVGMRVFQLDRPLNSLADLTV